MKHWMRPVAAILLVTSLAACGARKASGAERDGASDPGIRVGGPVVVEGTTLDASTRSPLAKVRVEGPGGVVAESDASGRFVLRGLSAGAEGELRASGPGDMSGSLRLRRLERGRLEVVVFLRPKAP